MKKGKKSENCHHGLKRFSAQWSYTETPPIGFSFYVWMGRGGSALDERAEDPLGSPCTGPRLLCREAPWPQAVVKAETFDIGVIDNVPTLGYIWNNAWYDFPFFLPFFGKEEHSVWWWMFLFDQVFNQLVSSSRARSQLLERGPAGDVMLAS